jgi:uncharacterized membrane protein YiaA
MESKRSDRLGRLPSTLSWVVIVSGLGTYLTRLWMGPHREAVACAPGAGCHAFATSGFPWADVWVIAVLIMGLFAVLFQMCLAVESRAGRRAAG